MEWGQDDDDGGGGGSEAFSLLDSFQSLNVAKRAGENNNVERKKFLENLQKFRREVE